MCKVNEPNVGYTSINIRKMMFIAYIYFLFYLEIDEQFGITAKIEAERSCMEIFYLKRISVFDAMTSPTSDQLVENHDLFWRHLHLRSFWSFKVIFGSNFYLWCWLIGKMLMFCENETIGIQIKFSWSRKSHLKLNIIRHEIWIMNFCRPLFWSQPMYL